MEFSHEKIDSTVQWYSIAVQEYLGIPQIGEWMDSHE